MSAKKYNDGFGKVGRLTRGQASGARTPRPLLANGLPPKLLMALQNYRAYKQASTAAQWRLPGYELLSRPDLLRR
jgi:hypothetical protein